MWPFKRKQAVETRSSGAGYTADIIAARRSYITGRQGIGELTATAQSAVSMWEGGFALADVDGTDMLDRRSLALTGRGLALRGEAVFLITEMGLVPAYDWDLTTRNGKPTAYRLSIADTGGGRTRNALAGEVLHFRTGSDPSAPYHGTAPLKRAQLTAGLLQTVEAALSEVFENAPLGSQIVPFPEAPETDMNALARGFIGRRGKVLIRESVNVTAAGGPSPMLDWKSQDVTPDLSRAMTKETLAAARDAISLAFGVLPAFANGSSTGPMIREAQRHLAQWTIQPMAMLMAEEANDKLGGSVMIDTLRPLQAYDVGGRARAFSAIIKAMGEAKLAGLSDAETEKALTMVNFGANDGAA